MVLLFSNLSNGFAQSDSTSTIKSNRHYKNRLTIGFNSPMAKINLPTLSGFGMRYATLGYERRVGQNNFINIGIHHGRTNQQFEKLYGLEIGFYSEIIFKNPKWSFRYGGNLFVLSYRLGKEETQGGTRSTGFALVAGINYSLSKRWVISSQIAPCIARIRTVPSQIYNEPFFFYQTKVGFNRLLSLEIKYAF